MFYKKKKKGRLKNCCFCCYMNVLKSKSVSLFIMLRISCLSKVNPSSRTKPLQSMLIQLGETPILAPLLGYVENTIAGTRHMYTIWALYALSLEVCFEVSWVDMNIHTELHRMFEARRNRTLTHLLTTNLKAEGTK